MSLNTGITKELLFAYFGGQASPLQKQRILEWMEEPANGEFFYACVHEWETGNPQYAADVNQAIEKFHQQFSVEPVPAAPFFQAAPEPPRQHWIPRLSAPGKGPRWLVAASVVLLLGFSSFLLGDQVWYKTIKTSYGQIKQVTLPDGSKVRLNANSALVVPRFGFGLFKRKLSLSGEACFDVVHMPDHKKFVVLTDRSFRVEVLGTAFNVFARERAIRVGLIKGKVRVLYGQVKMEPQTYTMAPGDLISLKKGQKTLQVSKVQHPENFAAWQQGRFIFENTPLAEIKTLLLENYGLTLDLKGTGLAQQTVSGSFKAASVEDLLQALAETMGVQVSHQGRQVVFTSHR